MTDSTIHTISVGASRTLRLTNRVELLREHDLPVTHGSLFSMSAQSQSEWSHELLYDPSIKEPRISFTFRHLIDPVPRVLAPPIERPPEPKPTIAMGSKHRILFLTDSILNRTPEPIFSRVKDHRCIKTTNYYLTDVFNFEPEFGYSEFVVISCGVNDMSTTKDRRPPMTGHVLADMVTRRLTDCCNRHTNTTFVFNSVLHTMHAWLNREINSFNRIIFELSLTIPNLRFFDSHEALMRDRISRVESNVIEPSDNRGTHITFAAKKLITNQLVSGIELIVGRRSGMYRGSSIRGWTWPLRSEYVVIFRRIAASFTAEDVR